MDEGDGAIEEGGEDGEGKRREKKNKQNVMKPSAESQKFTQHSSLTLPRY